MWFFYVTDEELFAGIPRNEIMLFTKKLLLAIGLIGLNSKATKCGELVMLFIFFDIYLFIYLFIQILE